jgi:hypothetical protein
MPTRAPPQTSRVGTSDAVIVGSDERRTAEEMAHSAAALIGRAVGLRCQHCGGEA